MMRIQKDNSQLIQKQRTQSNGFTKLIVKEKINVTDPLDLADTEYHLDFIQT